MSARSLNLILNGNVVGMTPMLVPSFSSKVIPDIGLIIKPMEEYMSDPILVSAYDIYYGENDDKFTKIDFPIVFGEIVFLDSGGYECSKDADLADIVYHDYMPKEWTEELHKSVLDSWPNIRPTVFTSFDDPRKKLTKKITIEEQIERANKLFSGRGNILTEILLKPETKDQQRLPIKSIIQ